jgi:hypothetical protein
LKLEFAVFDDAPRLHAPAVVFAGVIAGLESLKILYYDQMTSIAADAADSVVDREAHYLNYGEDCSIVDVEEVLELPHIPHRFEGDRYLVVDALK